MATSSQVDLPRIRQVISDQKGTLDTVNDIVGSGPPSMDTKTFVEDMMKECRGYHEYLQKMAESVLERQREGDSGEEIEILFDWIVDTMEQFNNTETTFLEWSSKLMGGEAPAPTDPKPDAAPSEVARMTAGTVPPTAPQVPAGEEGWKTKAKRKTKKEKSAAADDFPEAFPEFPPAGGGGDPFGAPPDQRSQAGSVFGGQSQGGGFGTFPETGGNNGAFPTTNAQPTANRGGDLGRSSEMQMRGEPSTFQSGNFDTVGWGRATPPAAMWGGEGAQASSALPSQGPAMSCALTCPQANYVEIEQTIGFDIFKETFKDSLVQACGIPAERIVVKAVKPMVK